MNNRIVALAVGLLLVFASGVVLAAEPVPASISKHEHRPGQVIVRVGEGFSRARVDQIALAVGARVDRDLGGLGLFLFVFDPKIPVFRMIARLERQPGVLYADPNNVVKLGPPSPELSRLKAEQAVALEGVTRLKLELAAADQALAAGQKQVQRAQEAVSEARRNLDEAAKVINKRLRLDTKHQAALAKATQQKEKSLLAKQALAEVNRKLQEAERAVNQTEDEYNKTRALVLKTATPINRRLFGRLFGGPQGYVRIVVISTAEAEKLKEKKREFESAIAGRKILIAQRTALRQRHEGALNDLGLARAERSEIALRIAGAIDKEQAQRAADQAAVELKDTMQKLQVVVDRQKDRSRHREEVSVQLDGSQDSLRDIDRRLAQFLFSTPTPGTAHRAQTEQTIGQVRVIQERLTQSALPAGLKAKEVSEMRLLGVGGPRRIARPRSN